jgi:hypothetical protein
MATYKAWREARQAEFNALPIFWAFSNEQLEKALAARGFKLEEAGRVLYRFGNGGFYLKTDHEKIKEFMEKDSAGELRELMESDEQFAREAFEYEMWNHEFAINWQGDYDVCECFCPCEYGEMKNGAAYLREGGYSEKIIKIYKECAVKVCNEMEC